ncbi:MAG: hypothetical protein FJZ96_01185 [Chloroflexi bacterium]|nr:hypothetical protein [Chloroflexota bacterium]
MENILALTNNISRIGQENPSSPDILGVELFENFFSADGQLDTYKLEKLDANSINRRELLTRFLLLSAVIDQGPDIVGVRQLLMMVTNDLYHSDVRFLHKPIAFFQELGIAIDHILEKHRSIKAVRSEVWARDNLSRASRYNLFMDNSTQTLNYAIFRWGVPLALPLLLEKDLAENKSHSPLLNYLESYPSAESMTYYLKSHERYGLGKAIGDKACHLFAKWLVSVFHLTRKNEPTWGPYSFEVPFDSNAGRVLWRTGYLLNWASEEDYIKHQVIQKGQGKGGLDYIRVTNIRGMATQRDITKEVSDAYIEISVNHLATHKKQPRKYEIQRLQHPFLMLGKQTVANFDDGLIHIGTQYCFNHAQPRCKECPQKSIVLDICIHPA